MIKTRSFPRKNRTKPANHARNKLCVHAFVHRGRTIPDVRSDLIRRIMEDPKPRRASVSSTIRRYRHSFVRSLSLQLLAFDINLSTGWPQRWLERCRVTARGERVVRSYQEMEMSSTVLRLNMLTRSALHHARSKTIFFLVKRTGRGRNDDEFSRAQYKLYRSTSRF